MRLKMKASSCWCIDLNCFTHAPLGNQKLAQKQYDEAIKLYTEAIKLNPTSAVYYANRYIFY